VFLGPSSVIEISFSLTVKKIRRIINGKTVYAIFINGKRVFEFATYNKPFLRVYYENNKRFFRL
jgi:hypothetical protein